MQNHIYPLYSHFRNNTWSFVSHAITQQTRFLTPQWTLTCLLLRPTWFVETGSWGWSWCWGQESGLNHTVTAVVGIYFLWSLDAVSEVCVYNALLPADCVFALSDQLLTNHTLNLWLDTFDCKIIARVTQWEATSLQTTVVWLGKTGIGIRWAGAGLQVTTV